MGGDEVGVPRNPCPSREATNHCSRRARGGKFGQSAPQPQPQKPANPPQRPGPHPTARTPKKPASQRQGSFAQWAKEQPTPGTPETPGKNGGYRPGGSGMGDEPRAKSNSYQSAKKADPPPSGNGAQDSWESDSDNVESILKSRPRQPYQRVYGERTKLFDGGKGSPEEEGRGRKPFKDAGATPTTPKKGGNSAGSYTPGLLRVGIVKLMPDRVATVLAAPGDYARVYANVSTSRGTRTLSLLARRYAKNAFGDASGALARREKISDTVN